MDLSPIRVPGWKQHGALHVGLAESVPLCGVKAASQGGRMGRRRQLQWFPVPSWSC